MKSQALVPNLLRESRTSAIMELAALATGVILLTLLAQIAIPLPGTPVPITGQTLGVALIALSWGRRRGAAVMAIYIGLGALGLPVFTSAPPGILLGPTFGYLMGMLAASFVVGWLADLGASRGFWRSLGAAYVGSAIIFACGVYGLSFYLPSQDLWLAGVLPFLPGDLIKNVIAALVSSQAAKSAQFDFVNFKG